MSVQFRPEMSPVSAGSVAAQSGKSQTTDHNQASSLSSSQSTGFFSSIADFFTMIFKAIFCCGCFSSESKEVKELKAQRETLVNFKAALEAFAKSDDDQDYSKATDALPAEMQQAFTAELQTMLHEQNKGEFDSHAEDAKFIFENPQGNLVVYKTDEQGRTITTNRGHPIIGQITFDGQAKRLEAVDRMIQAIDLKLQK